MMLQYGVIALCQRPTRQQQVSTSGTMQANMNMNKQVASMILRRLSVSGRVSFPGKLQTVSDRPGGLGDYALLILLRARH